jgi:hypothetical protein
MNHSPSGADREEILRALGMLYAPGDPVELRAPGGRKGTVSGYFTDMNALADAAVALSGTVEGVYVTLNPVNPALLARAANRVEPWAKHTTGDADIVLRRNVLIDIDATRPAGISATDAEHEAALTVAHGIYPWLTDTCGLSAASLILGDSGNGGHVDVAVDLPNDDATRVQVVRFLNALAARFDTDRVRIDTSVGNAARIVKLYGTLAAKGDSTPDRPHRLARLLAVPTTTVPLDAAAFAALVARWPTEEAAHHARTADGRGDFDVRVWLTTHGVIIKREKPWGDGGTVLELDACVFNPEHDRGEAAVIILATGMRLYKCHHNSCRGKTWSDLRALLEPRRPHVRARAYRTEEASWAGDEDAPPDADATTDEDPDRTGPTPGGSAGDRVQAGWRPLQPLPDDALPPVHTLPPTLLPAALRSWLVDAAERLSVPLELVASPALVMLGGLIGRRLSLCPKRHDDWVVVPNVWGAVITRPGFLKSPAMHEAKRHLDRLAAAASAAHETRAAAVEVERVIIETEIAKLKRDASGKDGDPESIRTTLAGLQQRLAAAVVIPTRFYTNDSTVEKLGVLLNENPAGLLLLRDELAGWLRTLDKPGREGDREFFLEAWNGVGSFYVDRIGRGSLHIPALTVGICGTMQPGKLQSYVAEALDEGRGADGLLQRFQLLVWPDFDGEWHNVDRPPDLAARERAWRVFDAVAMLSAGRLPAIRFAPDAQELFDAWRGELEARLRSDDEFTDCPAYESHVAKYRSLMPALALIHHVADTVDAAAEGSVSFVSASVGLAAAQTAAASVDFFDEHARRVYASELHKLRAPHALLAAKIRIGAVRDGDPIRDIGRHGWTCLKTAEAVEHACATLAPLGWVRIEEFHRAAQGGRPRRVLRVHPALGGTVA